MKTRKKKAAKKTAPLSLEAVLLQLLGNTGVKVKTSSPKKKVETFIENMTNEEWAIRAKAYKAAKAKGGKWADWNEAGAAAVWASRNA